ncbi:MAG: 1,2-phenylacetyl-CoA epoxidase subunit PaaC [Flavobacteriales bacterium]|nr:1,2-phenylacetyl-CoA epoxidase subunit PaaC [Flavobacteriales bacterium]
MTFHQRWATCENKGKKAKDPDKNRDSATLHKRQKTTAKDKKQVRKLNHEQKLEYLFRIADTHLIYGQRLSLWCGHGPVLEEDIALANIALDYLGQASNLLKHIAELEGKGRDEDALAFLREPMEYHNFLIVELPNGDYGRTIARQFFFSTWYFLFLQQLQNSSDEFLKGFAEKSIKEVRYHVQHSSDWVKRMGDGTEVSHYKIQTAINELWSYTGEFFETDEVDKQAVRSGIAGGSNELEAPWINIVNEVFSEATLSTPTGRHMIESGRSGIHTVSFESLLTEMQHLQRTYPGAKW